MLVLCGQKVIQNAIVSLIPQSWSAGGWLLKGPSVGGFRRAVSNVVVWRAARTQCGSGPGSVLQGTQTTGTQTTGTQTTGTQTTN